MTSPQARLLLAIAVVMTASSAVAARRSPAQVSGPAQGPSGFILGHVVESDSNAPVEGAVVTLTAWTDAAETLATVPPSRARGPAAAITVGRYSAIVGTRGRWARCKSATVTPSRASMAWAVAIRSGSADMPTTRQSIVEVSQ